MTPRGSEPPDFPASQLFLRRLAYSLVHDSTRAEDLVQDTWAAWAEHRPSGLAEPRAWLARVLRNRAFNARRDEARRARREQLAARPDPSEPETDGTLEAQARLIEALRQLDEPYRSTLVQRYYHDLSPAAIAERSGTPLNTVKARLARGLEKLRVELDRRYGGDRGAWCHWLMVLGSKPTVVGPGEVASPAPETLAGSIAAAGSAGAGSSGALGGWFLLAGAALGLVGWIVLRSHRPEVVPVPVTFEEERESEPVQLKRPRREALEPERVVAEQPTVPIAVVVEEEPQALVPPPLPFDWPQLYGTPSHDSFSAFPDCVDLIARPRILWVHSGLAGQPTIQGTELYSGGSHLCRVELATGEISYGSSEVSNRIAGSRRWKPNDENWQWWFASQGLNLSSEVGGAPAIASDRVLARLVLDGSVSAFDRDLHRELWHWQPANPWPSPLTGCLVGELFLAPHRAELVALRVPNGTEEWRFDARDAGEIDVTPACDGDLVYFATDRGVVFALELARGKERWRIETGRTYGWSHPVALGDRVVLVDQGPIVAGRYWRPEKELRAFQTYDGMELWKAKLSWTSRSHPTPGVGPGSLWVQQRDALVALSPESGERLGAIRLEGNIEDLWAPPRVVGTSIVAIEREQGLSVRNEKGEIRWSFAPKDTWLYDCVHTGDRIYVTTSRGLICIADDPAAPPAPPGFVLELGGPQDYLRTPAKKR